MSNLIIVESYNDKFFIEKLRDVLGLTNIEVEEPIEAWKACLITKGKPEISQKDFDKFWVSNYLRFDTCSKKEQKQANKNCKNEVAIKKDIWDFENPILNDLKEFLKILSK